MKPGYRTILLTGILIIATTSLVALEPHGSRVKLRSQSTTLDEDTVNSLSIASLGTSIVLRWHPQPTTIEWFVVRAFEPSLSDAETLMTTIDTVWVDNNILNGSNTRAFYWVAPRFPQEEPNDERVIEDFDGAVTLGSYPNQDQEPNGFSIDFGGPLNPDGNYLELYGNTWKTENIDTTEVHAGTVWRIAAQLLRRGEMQAFGMADSANEMWYSIDGTEQRISEAWIQTYQGWFGDSVWVWIDFSVGDDWFSHFGYYPNITRLMFANDNDGDSSHGRWQIDEIRDVTGAISLPPEAGFSWEIVSYVGDSMDVQFLPYSFDPEAPLAYSHWTFGDGTFSYVAQPVHRYLRGGRYSVACVVADTVGQLDWAVREVSDSISVAPLEFSGLFTGDVMMARRYEDEGLIPDLGVDSIFGRVQPLISSVDFASCNLECPLTNDSIHHPTKPIYFKGRPEYVEGLNFAGFDFCALANNHNMDYMVGGMHETKHVLDSVGILSTGSGDYEEIARAPVFFSKNGLCVAVLSFCNRDGTDDNARPYLAAGRSRPGFAMWDRAAIEEMLPRVRDIADLVVVEVHSGIEYDLTPPYLGRDGSDPEEPSILELLPDTSDVALRRYAIDMGADLIINHHPHVIQGCEVYNGKVIAHSMGNFAFNQTYAETFVTFALETRFSDAFGVNNFIVHPVFIDRYVPTPATGELGQAICDYESDLSRPMGTWMMRSPGMDTAVILLDTNITRSSQIYTDTLLLTDLDTSAVSAPFKLRGDGYPVSVTAVTPDVEIRVGREILMFGNMEQEGAREWNLNSNYERYDTLAYRGERSIRLNRAGGGTNSVSTNLLHRVPFNPDWPITMSGWMSGDNTRDATLQLELWNARGGGNRVGFWTIGGAQQGSFPWVQFWQDIEPPGNSWYFDVIMHLRSPTNGEGFLWFDDLQLVRWEPWQPTSMDVPFPGNIHFVQVRAPLGTTQAVIEYEIDWVE